MQKLKGWSKYLLSLNPYLGFLELQFLRFQPISTKPQLFIIGLPRSGTTLIYQYIIHRLKVSYITNRAGNMYMAPCLQTRFQKKYVHQYFSDFQSKYGRGNGALSPREAGSFWGRFFSNKDYIEIQDLPINRVNKLKQTIYCIQRCFGDLLLVNKNVKHMLRINVLNHIFPSAKFLIVSRNIEQVALSMLKGRYKNAPNQDDWWSVEPLNIVELRGLSVVEQIAGQIEALQVEFSNDLEMLPKDKLLFVEYELFCDNPEDIIQKLILEFGLEIKNTAVSSFVVSKKKPENEEEYYLLDLVGNYEFTR